MIMGRFVKRGLHAEHGSPQLCGEGTVILTWQVWDLRPFELRALGCFIVLENLPCPLYCPQQQLVCETP